MFDLAQAHADWYYDFIDDTESCFRLDTEEIQIQLIVKSADPETNVTWHSPHLFIERDRRDDTGDIRIDYACDGWDITDEMAKILLLADAATVTQQLEDRIRHVRGLPCDELYTGTTPQQREKLARKQSGNHNGNANP